MTLALTVLRVLFEGMLLYAAGTIVFDIIHYLLHRWEKSRFALLRFAGAQHRAHHVFLGPNLRFDDAYIGENRTRHLVPEWLTQVATICLGLFLFSPYSVLFAVALITSQFIGKIVLRGRDSNHKEMPVLPRPRQNFFVEPEYHLLHHVFPDSYISSFVTLFDWILGTGCQIEGRRFVVSGASGSFGSGMKALLESRGGIVTPIKFRRDYTYDDYERLTPVLANADVLVLCHGSKVVDAQKANCDSFVAIIEKFRSLHRGRQVPLEVWAVGSEIECHPSWGNAELAIYSDSKRAFQKHAKRLFHDRSLIYRHIVPASFQSPMGPGLISGKTAAWIALFFIQRGFRYVPVTYTGIAFLNYFKFALPGVSRSRAIAAYS